MVRLGKSCTCGVEYRSLESKNWGLYDLNFKAQVESQQEYNTLTNLWLMVCANFAYFICHAAILCQNLDLDNNWVETPRFCKAS